MRIPIRRGDVTDVDLKIALGAEKKNGKKAGFRPCLVVQNDGGNKVSDRTIIVPLTDVVQFKELPVQVLVPAEHLNFAWSKHSVAECGHVRAIDGDARIKRRRGRASDQVMVQVDEALHASLDLLKLNTLSPRAVRTIKQFEEELGMTQTTIILADDGRHVSVGRATEPSEPEIISSAQGLVALGLGGWLVRMSGPYYSPSEPVTLTMLRELASPARSFEEAEAKFLSLRGGR